MSSTSTKLRTVASVLSLFTLGLVACGEEHDNKPKPKPLQVDFEAASITAGPTVSMRAGATDGAAFEIELVGKELSNVYGLAYRVSFATSLLTLENVQAGTATSTMPERIDSARESEPGLIVGVLTARGNYAGMSVADGVLARLRFRAVHPGSGDIEFVSERSSIIDANGVPLAGVTWSGGIARAQ